MTTIITTPSRKVLPPRLTIEQFEASLTKWERVIGYILIPLQELCILSITGMLLYNAATTPTVWQFNPHAIDLVLLNLIPVAIALLWICLLWVHTVCPNNHITRRNPHSYFCGQCGCKLPDEL